MPVRPRLANAAPTLGLVAALALGLGLASHAFAQTPLAKDSPFAPVGGPEPTAAAASETIEFSGVVMGKTTLIIITDKVAKKSRLIPVGETVDGIHVQTYDSRREQVVVKIGTDQKTLALRKSSGAGNGVSAIPMAPNPAMNFNVPPPPPIEAVQKIQPPPPGSDGSAAIVPAPVPAKPEGPVTPPTIAKQEEEARMLVSDLLEIGMAQRKAYEEKQRQSAAAEQNAASVPPPAGTPRSGE